MTIRDSIIHLLGGYTNQPAPPTQTVEKSTEGSINEVIPAVVGANMEFWKTGKIRDAYNNNYVIYRGINLLAANIAKLPLRIYRRGEILPEDFILPGGFDLQNPAEDTSLYELLYETSIYFFYRGEWMAYVNLYEGSRRVFDLQVVNPKFMKEKYNKETGKIDGWIFDRNTYVPNDQLIYVKFLNPDKSRGLGPVDVVLDEIQTDRDAVEFNKKYFENFGKVGGTLYDDKGEATHEQMKKVVSEFNAHHQGTNSAHKILGLPRGLKYQELSQTMREMEFLESRKDIRDRILTVLGIHKAVVGVTDKVDRAVAETAMRVLWQLTLQPAAIRIENKLNQHLFKRYFPEYRCHFDFTSIEYLRTNRKELLEEAKTYRELGYTINEINARLQLQMEDIEGGVGDMRLVPQNLIPAEDYATPMETPANKSIDQPRPSQEVSDHIEKSIASINRRTRYLRRKYEKKFQSKMSRYFSKQLVKIIAEIKSTKAQEWDRLLVLAKIKRITVDDKSSLLKLLEPLYADGSKESVELAQSIINVESNPLVNDEVVNKLSNRIVGVNDHTYNLIRRQVVDADNLGETIDQLANRIRRVGKFNASRAKLIARTESATMVSASTHAEYQKQGIKKKRWITSRDDEVRETHRENERQGAIGINEAFRGTGEQYPSQFNCRCTIAPIVES